MRFLLTIVFACPTLLASETSDLIDRARRSSLIPNLSIRYSYRQDAPQVIWATLSWDFDEAIFGCAQSVAIEIKRLEREKELLTRSIQELQTDS